MIGPKDNTVQSNPIQLGPYAFNLCGFPVIPFHNLLLRYPSLTLLQARIRKCPFSICIIHVTHLVSDLAYLLLRMLISGCNSQ